MLEIQIVSDLHLEFWASKPKFNFIKPVAPILALLGDICCCGADDDFNTFKRFINEVLPLYEHIIMVPGNHEYYFNPTEKTAPVAKNTMEGIDEKICAYFKETSPKLHYLNNSTFKLTIGKTNYHFIGTALWSWIPEEFRVKVQSEMNDYQYIYTLDGKKCIGLTSDYVVQQHLKSFKYIKSQINKIKKTKDKIIVLTHHKPYLSESYNPTSLDVAYESDLSILFDLPIVLWCYGHTHVADNSVHGKVWFYSNPKGYPKQKTNYKKAMIVKV
jgi:predicted phosphodiesterase